MSQSDFDLLACLSLHMAGDVGAQTYKRLVRVFGSPAAAAAAPLDRLLEVDGVRENAAREIVRSREEGRAARELERSRELGVHVIPFESVEYPEQLRHIYDPPILLYVKGRLKREDALSVAVVGARHCSLYGKQQASRLSADLARAGFAVVSGLARGVDSSAHEGALSVSGGRTLAVLGNGLARVYPPENGPLAERVVANGALVSEFPLDATPQAQNFPRRNRIISGLTLGVIVVEGEEKSGSLITATHAADQGREVFAVPGRIDSPNSRGPNRLIKQGAKLVESVEDVIEELKTVAEPMLASLAPRRAEAPGRPAAEAEEGLFSLKLAGLNDRERTVAERLSNEPVHIDDIIRATGLGAQEVAGTLMVLEIRRVARQLPGKNFVRATTR